MRKKLLWMVLMLCLTAVLMLSVSAEKTVKSVDDYAELLTSADEARIGESIREAEAATDCDFYVMTWRIPSGIMEYDYTHRYTGEMFLRENGLSQSENIVILIISVQGDLFYYDMYTYGDAYGRIQQKEVNYILDHDTVYPALKSGKLADGACAFLTLSAQGYNGRVGVSYWIIAIVALCVALLIGGIACWSVYAAYTKRPRSVDYPLDRYAKLELTAKKDHFAGTFVTRRVIQSSSGGGGGGSFHGGGGGHRGGR